MVYTSSSWKTQGLESYVKQHYFLSAHHFLILIAMRLQFFLESSSSPIYTNLIRRPIKAPFQRWWVLSLGWNNRKMKMSGGDSPQCNAVNNVSIYPVWGCGFCLCRLFPKMTTIMSLCTVIMPWVTCISPLPTLNLGWSRYTLWPTDGAGVVSCQVWD